MQIPNTFLKNPQEFQNIIKIILSMADHITTYKMSNATKVKAEKSRQLYEATKAKEARKEKGEVIFFFHEFPSNFFRTKLHKKSLTKRKTLDQRKKRRKCRRNLLRLFNLYLKP